MLARLVFFAALIAGSSVSAQEAALGSPTVSTGAGSLAWTKLVSLAHPLTTNSPLFPGDPLFTSTIVNTIAADGYRLEKVTLGTHTGTHVSAPCHFITGGKCMDQLPVSTFVRPVVVIDVRQRTAQNPDFQLTKADIRDWERAHGTIPPTAIVLLLTGFGDHFFDPSYFNTAPGISGLAVRWLMKPVSEGGRGAGGTGSDTFGPDATNDLNFAATFETLAAGGVTLENLTNLDQLHDQGDSVVFLPARFAGSGYQTNVLAFVR